jgi:hypothetical protein
MSAAYQIQTAIGLIAAIVMCAAWWYAAIKFPRVWIFSGLAIVTTIAILFHVGVVLLITSGQTSGMVPPLASVQVLLHLVEAILVVLLVRWLGAGLKNKT